MLYICQWYYQFDSNIIRGSGGHELCVSLSPECWEIMEPVLQQRNLAPMPQVLQVLEALLCFDAWTHKESYCNQADHVAEATAKKAIRLLLHMVQKIFPRNEGNGGQQ